jgi:ankyrin repeat protein
VIFRVFIAHVTCSFQGGGTALMRASLYGHEEVVNLLLGHPSIEVNWANKVCLFFCFCAGIFVVVVGFLSVLTSHYYLLCNVLCTYYAYWCILRVER